MTSFDLAIGETWDGDTVAFVLPSIPSDAPQAVREGRAREACVELLAAARTVDSGSLEVRLLADLLRRPGQDVQRRHRQRAHRARRGAMG